MLTFEYDSEKERLCIHGDAEGLQRLQYLIDRLIDSTPSGTFDHSHLMTPDWGGTDLTSAPQDSTAAIIHHVKIYCWKGTQPA